LSSQTKQRSALDPMQTVAALFEGQARARNFVGHFQPPNGSLSHRAIRVTKALPSPRGLPSTAVSKHTISNLTISPRWFRSLALEGIDSARQWPSMSDTPEKSKKSGLGLSQKATTAKAAVITGSAERPHSSGQTSTLYYSTPTTRSSRVKDSITKESAPRKWVCQAVPFATLGGEMMLPLWIPSK